MAAIEFSSFFFHFCLKNIHALQDWGLHSNEGVHSHTFLREGGSFEGGGEMKVELSHHNLKSLGFPVVLPDSIPPFS